MSNKSKYETVLSGHPVLSYLNFNEVMSDADFKERPETRNVRPGGFVDIEGLIGEGLYELIKAHGHVAFKLVCNRSGGTLLQGNSCSWYAASGTVTSGTVTSVTAAVGSFVEDEDVWNLLYMLDDAGAGGAAPETEFGLITKAVLNAAETHITFTIQTSETDHEFTVAPAIGDTFLIESRSQVIPCTALDDIIGKYAGVVVRPSGIPDNYWGWIAVETGIDGYVAALIEAAHALTRHQGLRVASGADGSTISLSRLEEAAGGSLVEGQVVGMTAVQSSADIVSDLVPIHLGRFSVNET